MPYLKRALWLALPMIALLASALGFGLLRAELSRMEVSWSRLSYRFPLSVEAEEVRVKGLFLPRATLSLAPLDLVLGRPFLSISASGIALGSTSRGGVDLPGLLAQLEALSSVFSSAEVRDLGIDLPWLGSSRANLSLRGGELEVRFAAKGLEGRLFGLRLGKSPMAGLLEVSLGVPGEPLAVRLGEGLKVSVPPVGRLAGRFELSSAGGRPVARFELGSGALRVTGSLLEAGGPTLSLALSRVPISLSLALEGGRFSDDLLADGTLKVFWGDGLASLADLTLSGRKLSGRLVGCACGDLVWLSFDSRLMDGTARGWVASSRDGLALELWGEALDLSSLGFSDPIGLFAGRLVLARSGPRSELVVSGELERGSFRGVSFDRLALRAARSGGGWAFERLEVELKGGGRALASGAWGRGGSLRLWLEGVELSRLEPILGSRFSRGLLEGASVFGSAVLSAEGGLKEFVGDLRGLRLGGGVAELRSAIVLGERDKLRLRSGLLAFGDVSLLLVGEVSPVVSLEGELLSPSLEGLVSSVERMGFRVSSPKLGKEDISSGPVLGRLRLGLSEDVPTWRLELTGYDLRFARGLEFPVLEMSLSGEGSSVKLERGRLGLPSGSVSFEGLADGRGGLELRFRGDGVPASRVFFLVDAVSPSGAWDAVSSRAPIPGGRLSFEGRLKLGAKSSELEVAVSSGGLFLLGSSLRGRASLRFADGKLSLGDFDVENLGRLKPLDGRTWVLELSPQRLEVISKLLGLGDLKGEVSGKVYLPRELDLRRPELKALLSVKGLCLDRPLCASADVEASVVFSGAGLLVEQLRLYQGGVERALGSGRWSRGSGRLNLDLRDVRLGIGGDLAFTASGSVSLSGRVGLPEGRLDLELLDLSYRGAPLPGGFRFSGRALGGSASLDVMVSGGGRGPSLRIGSLLLDLRDVSTKALDLEVTPGLLKQILPLLGAELSVVEGLFHVSAREEKGSFSVRGGGSLLFKDLAWGGRKLVDRLTVEFAEGGAGGVPSVLIRGSKNGGELAGELSLGGRGLASGGLKLRLNSFPAGALGFERGRGTGDLELIPSAGSLLVRGDVALSDATLSLGGRGRRILRFDGLRLRFREGCSLSSGFYTLQVEGDLSLWGEGDDPLASGNLKVLGGRLDFMGTDFAVEDGLITMARQKPTEAKVDLRASSRVGSYLVRLSLSGRPGELIPSWSSEPPLDPRKIELMLATGVDVGEVSGDNGFSLEAFGAHGLRYSLMRGLEREIGRGLGLDWLSFSPSIVGHGPSLSFGKQLMPGVYLFHEYSPREGAGSWGVDLFLGGGLRLGLASGGPEERRLSLFWFFRM